MWPILEASDKTPVLTEVYGNLDALRLEDFFAPEGSESAAPSVMVQTWFTNRPEGDESNLLSWFDPVPLDQKKKVLGLMNEAYGTIGSADTFELTESGTLRKRHEADGIIGQTVISSASDIGRDFYMGMVRLLGDAKTASDFLYRAGIDGIKYPAVALNNAANRGGRAGWNYVAFSDENTRIDAIMSYSPETRAYRTTWRNPDAPAARLSVSANPAAPVTYDGQGRAILPSQRFNAAAPDIRYSRADITRSQSRS